MKKYLLIGSMALCLFAGCTEEEVASENSALRGTIQATIEENESQSRLAVNNDNSLSWTEGDAFEMFTSEGTSETWTLTSTSEGRGFFEGNKPEGTLNYAFYPTSEMNKPSLSGNVVTMTIPNELIYSENSTIDLPMYAKISGESLIFKYLTAMLKINVNEIPVGFHTLKVSASQAIAGEFSMDLSNGSIIASNDATKQKKDVIVSFNAISGTDNDRMFYLPLIPANYKSLKVSVSNGEKEIVLKEWANRSIQARKVYWASLMVKESDTTAPSGVTSELASLTAENPTVTITLTEPIVATEESIQVPIVEGASAVATLEFAQTPITTKDTPLKITETTASSEPMVEVSSAMVLSFPENDNNPVYLELETPQNTVTITSGNFKTIVAATAPNTFVVSKGVTIENLVVKAGNVMIQAGGKITGKIEQHEDNADEQTFVIVEEGVDLENVELGKNVTKVGGALVADETWYNDDATELEIDTPQDLYSFIQSLEKGYTFEGKTVKMIKDIDMLGYPLETSGMIKNTDRFTLFKGIFDGQGHSIKNLGMTYVPTESNGISTKSNVFVALIPRTEGATIQNITIEGGKVHVPSVAPDNDTFYLGTLVAFSNKSCFINCHNTGCEVLLESNGYAGGLIGSVGDSSQTNTHVIACTNSGSVKSTVTSGSSIANLGGIAGYGWGSSAYVVACYNTGVITGPSLEGYGFSIGGVAGDFGGYNYCYGCFNDAKVTGTTSGDLFGSASYSGYYNYSCYTGELFVGSDLASNKIEIKQVSSYAEAVETLNKGIDEYNKLETATVVRCEYRFVAGDKPILQLQQ